MLSIAVHMISTVKEIQLLHSIIVYLLTSVF
jgi:hypothetical protein